MRNFTKLKVFGFLAACFLFAANSSNPPNGRTGAPGDNGTCAGCHSGNNPALDGTVDITGVPSTIMAGSTYNLTVTVSNPNGAAVKGGFQMVALDGSNSNAGSMSNASTSSNIVMSGGRTYHEHNPAQSFGGGTTVTYSVDWTAPAGPNGDNITFYSAGVIANGNGGTSSDRVQTTSETGTLMASSSPPSAAIPSQTDVSCFGGSDGTATAVGSGGTGPYNYDWSDGQTNAMAINLAAGTYTVTVTDAANLTGTASTVINQPSSGVVVTASITSPITCNGADDGSAMALGAGGTGPYMYNWSNGFSGPVLNNLGPNSYVVTITDANSCQSTDQVNLTEPTLVTGSVVSQGDATCGAANGFATVAGAGGTPGYFYSWPGGASGPMQTNLAAGVYPVTISDFNSCVGNVIVNIGSTGGININLEFQQNISCNGEDDGSIDVSASGGTSPYNFNWSNGDSGPSISNLSAGSYTVTATDVNNCSATLSSTISEPPALNVSHVVNNNVTCYGEEDDGSATFTVSGGTPNYNYSWPDGTGGSTNNDLAAGSHDVTITDANMCEVIQTVIITEPAEIIVTITGTDESSSGAQDGTLDAMASGGTPGYMWNWSNGDMTQMITGLSPGNYYVTVTDMNNCSVIDTGTVSPAGCNITATAVITNEECVGELIGEITVSPAGGIGAYSFDWSSGENTATISNLSGGTYTVTITDDVFCTFTDSYFVDELPGFEVEINEIIQPVCPGESSGEIEAVATGLSGPFEYEWSNGPTTPENPGISSGGYSVTVTDIFDCTIITFYELGFSDDNPPNMIIGDAILYLDESGVAPPLQDSDFDLGTSDDCGNFAFVYDSDSLDCSDLGSFDVEISAVDINQNIVTSTITVTVVDTVPPTLMCLDDITIATCEAYDYLPPLFSDNCTITNNPMLIDGLPSGTVFPPGITTQVYELTDNAGNTTICSFEINNTGGVMADGDGSFVCPGVCDGEITIIASGGTPPYSYSPGDLTGLCAGDYEVVVTDSDGCFTSLVVTVPELDAMVLDDQTIVQPSVTNDDGSIDITITGGGSAYTYDWYLDGDFFSNDEDLSGLAAGSYTCNIFDGNGCEFEIGPFVLEGPSSVFNDKLSLEFVMSPNPADQFVLIDVKDQFKSNYDLSIYDLDGKVILTNTYYQKQVQLDFKDLPSGVYAIRIETEKMVNVKRILIQH